MRAGVAPVVIDPVGPPALRLRYLLILGFAGLMVWSAVPRLRAAWQLHSIATAFADYALCMAGPTGPSLLRDNPVEFRRLVRRRLVAASADDRPFNRCAKGAQVVTGSAAVERAHRATASSFVEYGAEGADGAPGAVRLDDLAVTTRPLAETADAAWPFVRGGYTSLVQASAYAAEAPHPVELPRPGVGRGAVASRSLTRCDSPEGKATFVLGASPERRAKIVRSVTPEGVTSDATLAPMDARVFAVSCDDRAVTVAMGRQGTRDVQLVTCAYLGSCAAMPLPRFGSAGPPVRYPLDMVRVLGAIVVAAPMHGIVRVASTRDDGKTWTPFTVAFDPEAHPEVRADVPLPDHLLVSGHRVLLHGVGSRPSATFPLLASDDEGASFRAP